MRTGILVALLVLLAPVAHADQLAWLQEPVARRAVRELQPGTFFVQWVSHLEEPCTLYRLQSTQIAYTHSGDHVVIEVTAVPVAIGHRETDAWKDPFRWSTPRARDTQTFSIDLAYIYTPSRDLRGLFVNLARRLRLTAHIRIPALEVPGRWTRSSPAQVPIPNEIPNPAPVPPKRTSARPLH